MGTPEEQTTDSQQPNQGSGEQGINYEKRYKDTQSSYTKSQQELKAAKAKLEALEKLTAPKIEVDAQTQQELEDLKFSDPEAWRNKMNRLETEARQKHSEALDVAASEAIKQDTVERRAQVLAEFNQSHGLNITDETIQFDVPPRLTKQLESGELGFEDYLYKVADYLGTPKKVGDTNKVLGQPNLGNAGGDDTPTKGAEEKDFMQEIQSGSIVF